MSLLDTKHKRKSAAITGSLLIVLFLLLFVTIFTFLDPPPEKGIAINFGSSQAGGGSPAVSQPAAAQPQESASQQSTPDVQDNVTTSETADAPVVNNNPATQTTTDPKPVDPKPDPKPEPKPDPKPDASTNSAIDNILNNPDAQPSDGGNGGGTGGGNGPANGPGDDIYGSGVGTDGDGNYRLGGRRGVSKVKPQDQCTNEEGYVVVRIEVDRTGKVTKAQPGVGGTTNQSACLAAAAKLAAERTKFNADNNAPARQVGTIKYYFKLGE